MHLVRWLGIAALAAGAACAAVSWLADRDVRAREAQLAVAGHIAHTARGPVEYTAWGDGPVVLVLHGAGGGFDQGRLIAEAYGGAGFRWIAPSRFGYLGSPLPADASTPAQADALAALLDSLGIERVAVLAFSGGVPPALQLAERHPRRVVALVLLSGAPFTPYAPPPATRAMPDWAYQALFGNDAVYWALTRAAPDTLAQAFDARAELRASLAPEEARFVAQLTSSFMPASRRLAGVRNEGAAIDPATGYALERIAAPALIIHARDDRLNAFAVSEAASRRIPGARLVPLDTGGHLLLGHHAAVRAQVSAFLTGAWKGSVQD